MRGGEKSEKQKGVQMARRDLAFRVTIVRRVLDGTAIVRGTQSWFLRELKLETGREFGKASVSRWFSGEAEIDPAAIKGLEKIEEKARKNLRALLADLGRAPRGG